MVKFRRLTIEELSALEKEFIDYLVVNGISPEEWEGLKINESPKAEKIIDLFSDVIMTGVLRKINFLEFRSAAYYAAMQCLDDRMILAAMSRSDDQIDLREIDWASASDKVVFYRSEKAYTKERELELFELITKGYLASDGKLFKTLVLASVEN